MVKPQNSFAVPIFGVDVAFVWSKPIVDCGLLPSSIGLGEFDQSGAFFGCEEVIYDLDVVSRVDISQGCF